MLASAPTMDSASDDYQSVTYALVRITTLLLESRGDTDTNAVTGIAADEPTGTKTTRRRRSSRTGTRKEPPISIPSDFAFSRVFAKIGARMNEFGYDSKHVLPHGSYLINLGNPDE
ncbi:hypothetical protein PAXRUDRAFT_21305 [Paxillus rubicundulus Ve08.2h10]|uniref:Uncharacterized protein n=1 Tax=Paxillus rubicundulus Ve08.2h10 TaxID=930991 RepID=A0A0D0CQF3_9AGAM|nr:hypothetical protein PAXRUDRAFT_21305 [Paxillus rubicundulus Ve08.2h10]